MPRLLLLLCVAAAGIAPHTASAASEVQPPKVYTFTAFANASNTAAAGTPVKGSDASATANFTLSVPVTASNSTPLMQWALNVSAIQNLTMAHLHLGSATTSGPAVLVLLPVGGVDTAVGHPELSPPLTVPSSQVASFSSSFNDFLPVGDTPSNATAMLLAAAADNSTAPLPIYVNLHTSSNPAGAIRGQLVLSPPSSASSAAPSPSPSPSPRPSSPWPSPRPSPSPVQGSGYGYGYGATPPPSDSSSGLSGGAIAGIVVGSLAGVAALAAAFLLLRRKRSRQAPITDTSSIPSSKPDDLPPILPAGSAGGGTRGGTTASQLSSLEDGKATLLLALPKATPSLGSPATPTPGADAAGRASTDTGSDAENVAMLARDPLLSYIASHTSQASDVSRRSGRSRTSSGFDAAQMWELRFSDLKFKQPIGEGSFGKVYRAVWQGTPVAVKVLMAGGSGGGDYASSLTLRPEMLRRLEEEAGLMASMRHPNVVSFYGIVTSPCACIVSEFCSRGSLTGFLRQAREDPRLGVQLSWQRRLQIALDAALGMRYLHSRSICHRDLKSPNLLVDAQWKIKVTDFNLSRLMTGEGGAGGVATTGTLMGLNPRWLAPELMMGERATPASDVFSYGVVMWEIATWSIPFEAVANHFTLPIEIMAGARLAVPARQELPGPDNFAFQGLDAYLSLMQRCWAQEPQDRPSFQEVADQLEAMLEEMGAKS